MNWIPKTTDRKYSIFLKKLYEMVSSFEIPLDISDKLPSRVAVSGDISGIPIYHFRWKIKLLPDLVIWPTETLQISRIMKLANEFSIPVTVRGGGTCYFGSSISTMGGVVLDMKRMNACYVDSKKRYANVQGGAIFFSLLKLLNKSDLALPTYPTSYKSATFGGWFNSNNEYGIGTYRHNSFFQNVLEITLVKPDGTVERINDPLRIHEISASYGTLGIISELKLHLIKKRPIKSHVFSFQNDISILEQISSFTNDLEISYLSFGDSLLEERLHLLLFSENTSDEHSNQLKETIKNLGGEFLGSEISENFLNYIPRIELYPKKQDKILLFQIFIISNQIIPIILNKFHTLCKKYRLPSNNFNITFSHERKSKLMIYVLTDNLNWVEFLAAKAILHKTTKAVYKNQGCCHTIGMQNTMYLMRFQPEKFRETRNTKKKIDPNLIMNPLKIISTKISYLRINLMFQLTLFFRRIQMLLKKEKSAEFIPNFNNNIKVKSTEFRQCISCGVCRENCPNYTLLKSEEFSACGRNRVMRFYIETQKPIDSDLIAVMFNCTTCNQCGANCPTSYDFVGHLENIRKELIQKENN